MNQYVRTAIFLAFIGFAAPAFAGPTCPVMRGERAKEKYSVDYKGKHILFCCRSCIKKFNAHPEKYIGKA